MSIWKISHFFHVFVIDSPTPASNEMRVNVIYFVLVIAIKGEYICCTQWCSSNKNIKTRKNKTECQVQSIKYRLVVCGNVIKRK